ncbi:MAG: isoaspartyl peptidase/L-asparaginase [Nitrososphaeria archaeon]|nr:isoaspartyl peptidase/L-asparaginase [Nitrososphaeria archaeon]
MWCIVVHGGAGLWSEKEKFPTIKNTILKSLEAGAFILSAGGSALDAVVDSVMVLEDSGVLNAGVGAYPNLVGEIEMDAGVMDGKSLKAGAVASVRNVKNPVLAAKLVLERTDHVLLVGEWASKFALFMGLPSLNFDRNANLLRYRDLVKKFEEGNTRYKSNLTLYKQYPELFHETVGAVALDCEGNLASATSTGGLALKLPGRVGDSPIIGAGTYADRNIAVSTTGIGEYIILLGVGIRASQYAENGLSAKDAAENIIQLLTSRFGKNSGGLIALDKNGVIGISYNTPGMARGYYSSRMSEPYAEVP